MKDEGSPRFLLLLVIVASCAITVGRIISVPGPFGPNDLSRWATIAALVETGSYSIGKRVTEPDGSYRDLKPPVQIDVLLHPETKEFFSSKPPLLPTLLAGEMIVLRALGLEPARDGARILRVMLLTSNAIPIALFLVALLLLLERLDASSRAASILMITAGFGTLLTTFATTITNHVGATAAAGIAVHAFARIWLDRAASAKWYLLAGFGAGWTASQEVPALCLVAGCAIPLAARSPKQTLAFFLPAALVPLIAFWITNHLALGDPFWFYHPDPTWSKFPGSYWTQKVGIDRGERSSFAYVFHFTFGHHGMLSLAPIFVASFAGMLRLLDRSRLESLLAALFLFALTVVLRHLYREMSLPLPIAMAPIALIAIAALMFRWKRSFDDTKQMLVRISAFVTLMTCGFYLVHTSNYGGVSCGPRWMMWLVPFWLIAALGPIESALASKKGRALVVAALAVSIFSASAPGLNPWTHPWLYFGP